MKVLLCTYFVISLNALRPTFVNDTYDLSFSHFQNIGIATIFPTLSVSAPTTL